MDILGITSKDLSDLRQCSNFGDDFSRYIYCIVSPCVGGSKVPPRTLYRIKCVLAEILYGCQNKMVASTLRVKNSCAKPASISNTRHRQV